MRTMLRPMVVMLMATLLAGGTPVYGQEPTPAQTPASAPSQPEPRKLSVGPDYSQGNRFFPTVFLPYTPIRVEAPQLTNSPRINELIQDGKLMLSLQDAVSLALENNLDIRVQRYQPYFAETDLLRAKAGAVIRGLSGTGTASALGSIPTATFDPVLTGTFSWSRAAIPVNNPFLTGVGTSLVPFLINYNNTVNLQYAQGFHTGTAMSVVFDNARTSTTSPSNLFNPAVQSSLFFNVQQQLLNGFGLLPNTRFILEAKNNVKAANWVLAQQVMTTVTNVENTYWELVFARQNVKVQEAAVATSEKLYNDNKKQVEIGTLAPIEVVRAESEVAADRQAQIVAETVRLQQQTLLLNLITKNPVTPELINIEVVPTDTASTPPPSDIVPLQDAVQEAWQKRPELQQADLNLKNAHLEVRATRNALFPILTAFGQYGFTGLGGNKVSGTRTLVPDTTAPIVDANGNPVTVINDGGTTPIPIFVPTFTTTGATLVPGGLSDALSALIHNNFPTYGAGVNLSLPIRNRSAQADSARALLQERQLQTQFRQLQNTIVVDVRNAQIAFQQGQARLEAAQKARALAQQTLEAEQKKYQLGVSNSFLVIQAQRDVVTAEGNEIRAKVDLQEARVAYDRALGRTLETNRITISDARHGHIYRPPLIPGTPSTAFSDGTQ